MKGARVVKEIQIRNFRSLKDTGLQTLSPITLLVGENSSGKSTFLRAFPLLKQSINKRTSGPILWAGDIDDYVDFGSFEETVTNDQSNTIVFRYRFCTNNLGAIQRYIRLSRFVQDFSEEICDDEIDFEITISSSKGRDYVSKFMLSVNSIKVQFDLVEKSVRIDGELDFVEPNSHTAKNSVSKKSTVQHGYTAAESRAFGFILPNIDILWDELMENFFGGETEDLSFYRISDVILEIGNKLSRNEKISLISEDKESNPAWYINDYNRFVESFLSSNNSRMAEIIKLCYIYKVFSDIDLYIVSYFQNVHYIAPLRATAERYYRLRNLAIDEVDYQGKNLAIFINSLTPRQLKDFRLWTNEHFGFSVQTDKSKGHLSLLINLANANKAINLSDTGFGYSQVLPIITQLWELSTRKKENNKNIYLYEPLVPLVVAIEQPELHLHPAVQAKLAKAFIACINLARENGYQLQLLLETHSQTIVDYFGRAIARGVLSSKDVSVILFEKQSDSETTVVKNSFYDVDGYLNDWPYGFFDSEE